MKKLALLMLPLMLQACGEQPTNSNTTASTTATTTEAATPTETPMTVTADELLKSYKENELAGDQKYKDKLLIVTGKLDSIQSGIGDSPFILLKAGGDMEFNKPQAHFDKSQSADLAKLKKGTAIKIQCTGNGEIAGAPMLKDCKVL